MRTLAGRTSLRALDLFAGAGGLSEGLRQAGYRVVGAVEWDAVACKAYRLNHPQTKIWEGDIANVTGKAILEGLRMQKGELDLLAACPPCQGFSTMRTMNGARRVRDPRNTLIDEVLRLIRVIRPRAVMIENVPGLAKSRRFNEFRASLATLGYHVRWEIMNVADFAVPQRRRRLVLLAALSALPKLPRPLLRWRTVRETIGQLTAPERSRDTLHNYSVRNSPRVEDIIRKIPLDGGSRSALSTKDQLPCHRRVDGFRDVYGRMAWDKPAPTITGGCINPSKGRFLHPVAARAITLREAALLQTFPRSYRFPVEDGRYRVALLIGNALPPEFIRRHAVALRGALTS